MYEAIMFGIFGKRFIKRDMLRGLRGAIFVNEMEIAMAKDKFNTQVKIKENLEKEYQSLLDSPLKNAIDLLPEDQKGDSKAIYDMEKKIKGERAEQIESFKQAIKSVTSEAAVAESEVDRSMGIAYSNRRKYDFIRKFKIVPTYADKNK
jgi:hypothetical protein